MTVATWLKGMSETELYEILQQLLLAMGYHSVKITHGPIEAGKDLVFAETDKIGRRIWRSIQAKADILSGSLTSKKGLRAALSQCEAALETAYLDHNGTSVEMSEVWLVSTHPISQQAILTASGALKRIRHVQIIDGPNLGELITKHLPTLMESESNPLNSYLKALVEFCDSPEEYLSTRMRARYSFTQVYVPPIVSLRIPRLVNHFQYSVTAMLGVAGIMPELEKLAALASLRRLPGWRVPHLLNLLETLKTVAVGSRCLPAVERQADTLELAAGGLRAFLGIRPEDSEPHKVARDLSISVDYSFLMSIQLTEQESSEISPRDHDRGALRPEDFDQQIKEFGSTREPEARKSLQTVIEDRARQSITATEKSAADSCIKELVDSMIIWDRAIAELFHSLATTISPHLDPEGHLASDAPDAAFSSLHNLSLINQLLSVGLTVEEYEVLTDGLELGKRLRRLMFVGPLGIGKTTLLKQICSTLASTRAEQDRRSVPVFSVLGTIRAQTTQRTADLLLEGGKESFVGSTNYPLEEIDWLLDGFDELETVAVRKQILKWCADPTNASRTIILTSRPGALAQYIPGLACAVIKPFSPRQKTDYILKFPWADSTKAERTINVLKTNSELAALSEIPLLLTLILLLAQQQDPEKLPGRRDELYDRIAKLLMGEWDASKGVSRAHAVDALELRMAVIEKTAYTLYALRRASFTRQDFCHICLGGVPTSTINPAAAEALFDDMVADCLLVPASRLEFKFFHFSIHEYLAAKDLSRDVTPERVERSIIEYFRSGGAWWEEVLTFYAGIKRDLRGLIAGRLLNLLPNVSPENPVLLMRLLHRWLEAADLTDLEKVTVKGTTVQSALLRLGLPFGR